MTASRNLRRRRRRIEGSKRERERGRGREKETSVAFSHPSPIVYLQTSPQFVGGTTFHHRPNLFSPQTARAVGGEDLHFATFSSSRSFPESKRPRITRFSSKVTAHPDRRRRRHRLPRQRSTTSNYLLTTA